MIDRDWYLPQVGAVAIFCNRLAVSKIDDYNITVNLSESFDDAIGQYQ